MATEVTGFIGFLPAPTGKETFKLIAGQITTKIINESHNVDNIDWEAFYIAHGLIDVEFSVYRAYKTDTLEIGYILYDGIDEKGQVKV